MRSTRWLEAGLAAIFAVVLLAIGARALWSVSRPPIHDTPSAVPSTAAAADLVRYAQPIEKSRQLARALVAGDNLPGLSVAIALDGEIAWAEGFGWADVEDRTPVTPLTRFRLGALSKPLTAFGAALLHDRGRLDLDAPVQRYVPAYGQRQWTVTTRQLMGDVAGVHRIRGDNNDAMPGSRCANVNEAVAMLADDPLLFEPGTRHRYSIWGWTLVSAVVEGAAGEPFSRFMTGQVFEPLRMTRTVTGESDGTPDIAHRTERRPDYSCLAGGGAFLSTPSDLVRVGSAMLKPGVLKAETIRVFQTPTRLVSGASTTYALGWTVGTVPLAGKPARMLSHRGSPAGGTVMLLTFPDLGVAIAAAGNVNNATGVQPFALQVVEAFSEGRNRGHCC